ncbi:hypothetical protein K0O64_14520 [Mycolicibacterium pallens]|uniref:Secreted protein n=2 Tax=Mycolicibacterium pallens TaxID=370524 RepID=A0ABX8VP60_9MYCO|nr:hypothetical protein K0O64_14520 [Mycolicibacterium pallens]
MMRGLRSVTMWLAAVGVLPCVSVPSSAHAADEWGLNGTFTATSNGEWARTNDVFHDEKSVRSNWAIATQCSYPTECTGTVTSDAGWSAPIYQTGGMWYVKRTVDNWEPCPDGTSADGLQVFWFQPMTPGGDAGDPDSTTLLGEDQTTGPSGACGRSLALFVNMPFKLVKQH